MCLLSDPPWILVVDDEPLLRWGLVETLRDAGFGVKEASCGQDALQMCSSGVFDVLLLDRFLGDLDGLNVLAELKASGPDRTVIVMTGTDLPGVEHQAMSLGAHKFLLKPLDMALVLSLVQAAISIRIAAGC